MSPEVNIRLPKGWGPILLLVVAVVGGYWMMDWSRTCYGPEGRLEFREHGWGGKYANFGHGYDTGLMYLQEGQRVLVSYEASFQGWECAYIWFGPLEEWFKRQYWPGWKGGFFWSKTKLGIRKPSGGAEFAASKTGFHILHYVLNRSTGNTQADFTISWRAF